MRYFSNSKQIDYQLVDLGLPSGTLWADRNVGANTITDFGSYFAWGETSERKRYDINEDVDVSKLVLKGILKLEHDAAFMNMRGPWRTPTETEFEELFSNTKMKYVSNYKGSNVNGLLFTAKNKECLFFPFGGYKNFDRLVSRDVFGDYWISNCVSYLSIGESRRVIGQVKPSFGFNVRAVMQQP